MPKLVANQVEVFPFRRTPDGVEFLMLQRTAGDTLGGTWHAVHGSIEPGETAIRAARRELLEEAGVQTERLWQIDFVGVFFLAARDEIHHNAIFTAELPADVTIQLSEEHDAFRWVTGDEAPRAFMWPNQRHAIREIMYEIIEPGPGEPYLRIK